MDEGIKIGIILLLASIIVVGVGYYYMTKKLPKE